MGVKCFWISWRIRSSVCVVVGGGCCLSFGGFICFGSCGFVWVVLGLCYFGFFLWVFV